MSTQVVAYVVLAVLVVVVVAIVERASRGRATEVALGVPPPARRRRGGSLELTVAAIAVAAILEAWGTWVSLRAYVSFPPSPWNALKLVAVLLVSAVLAYLMYLWTDRRITLRSR